MSLAGGRLALGVLKPLHLPLTLSQSFETRRP